MNICIENRPTDHWKPAFNPNGPARFLGRLQVGDPRNANFRYRAVRRQLSAAIGVEKTRTRRAWGVDNKRLPLNQGRTPRCVGFSIATAAVVGPKAQRKGLPTRAAAEELANSLYVRACHIDEWAGDDLGSGTSVNAGMKAAVEAGLFGSYAWGENVADVMDFGLHFGPVNMGSIWPDSMMETDRFGYLNIDPNSTMDGAHAAGHAWCITTFDTTGKNPDGTVGFVEMEQTWGKPWGLRNVGRARMTVTTLGALIMVGADIAFGTEITLKARPAIVGGADVERAAAA